MSDAEKMKWIILKGGTNDGKRMQIPTYNDQLRIPKVIQNERVGNTLPPWENTEYYRSSMELTEDSAEIFILVE